MNAWSQKRNVKIGFNSPKEPPNLLPTDLNNNNNNNSHHHGNHNCEFSTFVCGCFLQFVWDYQAIKDFIYRIIKILKIIAQGLNWSIKL